MKLLLFATQNDWIGFILRITLGVIMFPHGAQKLFGWFGGFGFTPTMDFFTKSMSLPWIISILVIIVEFFGSIGLIIGITSRLWAFGLMIIMIGAILTAHINFGFFMNWFGNQTGEGYEYHLLVIGICLATIVSGSGKFSIDSIIIQ
ncbi:DoxX family protein [bacterium]|nr:MAG: DoxX family protein [bacterium]